MSAQHRRPSAWPFVLLAMLLAVIAGLAAATGIPLIAGVLGAAVVGAGLLANPRIHVVISVFFAMVATGILEFFFFFGQANWLSSLLVGSGLLAAAVAALAAPNRLERRGISFLAVLTGLYFLVLAFSTAINRIPVGQVIVGVRNYVPYFGIAALLIYCRLGPEFVRKLPLGLLAIGLLQVPFSLFQHFVTGPWRATLRNAVGRSDEAIVGTFGGSAITGGYTGEMAAFLVMCIVFVVALRRERLVGNFLSIVVAITLLVPVLLAETKVSLILLPVLIIVCFARDAMRDPRFFATALLVGLLLFSAIATVYFFRYWQDGHSALRTLGYSFDPDFMVTRYHRGRVGTIVHWFHTIPGVGNWVAAFIGHGVASSLENSATIGAGTAVIHYGLGLDSHAMSRLLWDAGIVGFLLFLAIGIRTFLVARKLAQAQQFEPLVRASLVFASGSALAMAMMLPYQQSVLGGSAMQMLFWFTVGYVEYQRRQGGAAISEVSSKMNVPSIR